MLRSHSPLLALVLLAACSHDPPCPAGQAGPAWQSAPLSTQLPAGVHVCQLPASETASHLQFWVDSDVHRANMDAVDRAQNNGWDRTSDNWYSSTGDFNTPKWSEFRNASGQLRVEVHEAGGGAMVDVRFTPG